MKNLTLLGAIIFGAILLSCGGDSSLDDPFNNDGQTTASIYIDNGVDTTVFVTISAEESDKTWEYEIEGYGGEATYLPHGKYHINAVTVADSTIVDEDFELDKYSYNLNLTREDYIIENFTYYVDPSDAEGLHFSFKYKGETFDGWDAEVVKGKLVIPNDWDYNLGQETPEEVELPAGQRELTKRKLWRASTFILLLQFEKIIKEYGEDYELAGEAELEEILEDF